MRNFKKRLFFTALFITSSANFFLFQNFTPGEVVCQKYSGSVNPQSNRSAYPTDFFQPIGSSYTYVAWAWRETIMSETTHTLSVARTRDLKSWQDSCGTPLSLPLTIQNAEVIDQIPQGGGFLNNVKIGQDLSNNPVVSYMKFVTVNGKKTTQVFNARLYNGQWRISQVTNFNTAYEFSGGGSLAATSNSIGFSSVSVNRYGKMLQAFSPSKSDGSPIPTAGTYELVDQDGVLVLGNRYSEPASTDTFYKTAPGFPSTALASRAQVENFATNFQIKSLKPRFGEQDNRYVPIRGDFDGDQVNDGGLYDVQQSAFSYLSSAKGQRTSVSFGGKYHSYEPVIGFWKGSSLGIGVYSSIDSRTYLKDVFGGGGADEVLKTLPPSIVDTPRKWWPRLPGNLYQLVWDTLPTSGDMPYDCSGKITDRTKNQAVTIPQDCGQKFARNLVLWSFDQVSQKWTSETVSKVWGGMSVAFDYLVYKNYHIIAYYADDRHLTVAMKKIGEERWQIKSLDSIYDGWDSHNSITLMVDENQDIHVSGNQHVNPLNYFRSQGLDLASLERRPMTGLQETRVTYPKFFRSTKGELLFSYRDGKSGDGNTIINVYDSFGKVWGNLNSQMIFKGSN
jgi:BNR repeat-containing family member